MTWELYLTDEVDAWLDELAASDVDSYRQAVAGIKVRSADNSASWRPSATSNSKSADRFTGEVDQDERGHPERCRAPQLTSNVRDGNGE